MSSKNISSIIPFLNNEISVGTLFPKKPNPLNDKKWWILNGLTTYGTLMIDVGACISIRNKNSLFATGIVSVTGSFVANQAVLIIDSGNVVVARGLVNYSSAEITRIIGVQSSDFLGVLGFVGEEFVVHRDNLVLVG